MKQFKDKHVVITGAASGIGRSTALAFARCGARLYLADIQAGHLNQVRDELQQLGAEAWTCTVDVSDRAAMQRFAEEVFEQAGRVDILHSNAGISVGANAEETTLDDWERILDINLWGAIYGVHFFVPKMIAQDGEAHIIITSSAAGLTGLPGLIAYSASKFALVGMADVMNIELTKYGIHTTTLCPGFVNTPLAGNTPMRLTDKKGENRKERIVRFYQQHGASPDRVARDLLKAVRRKRPIQTSPGLHVLPIWWLRRISVRRYHSLMRLVAKFVN